jgi:flagellar biogenesis protein FliO
MKPNYKHLSVLLLGALYIVGMLYFLYGCSANYHFTKFLNKGGKIDTTERVVTVEKTIKVNGKDSIIFVQMPLNCPEVQIPPTRTEIRYKYRLKRDSIETVRYVTKWKTKLVKIEKKAEKTSVWNWFFGGLCLGIWIAVFLAYLIKRK